MVTDPGEGYPDEAGSGTRLQLVDPEAPAPLPSLDLNKKGAPLKTINNVIDLLSIHADWEGVLAYDEFSQCIVKRRRPPSRDQDRGAGKWEGEWDKPDAIRACSWLSSRREPFHRMVVDVGMVNQAALIVAERKMFHPVRDWLSSLKWDGTRRLVSLFPYYFRAVDTQFSREAGRRWLISAVARVWQPGCQVKYMPVLEGPQDLGKSTGIQALVGAQWFSDTGLMIGNKDSYQCLRGKIAHEWAELASFKSAKDIESLKGFISSPVDNYRRSYDDRNRDFPRQCVFIGTTNEERWLTDPTGGSRFWPIRCRGEHVLRDELAADREQLWAEANSDYHDGHKWYFDAKEEAGLAGEAREQQDARRDADPWTGIIAKWLESPSVPDQVSGGRRVLHIGKHGFAGWDILTGALDLKRGECDRRYENRLGKVMLELGYDARQVRVDKGRREYRYFTGESGKAPF